MSKLGDIKEKGLERVPFLPTKPKWNKAIEGNKKVYPDLEPTFWEILRKFFMNEVDGIMAGSNPNLKLTGILAVIVTIITLLIKLFG